MKNREIIFLLSFIHTVYMQGMALPRGILSRCSRTAFQRQTRSFTTSETEKMMQQHYPHSWWLFTDYIEYNYHGALYNVDVICPRMYNNSRFVAPGLTSLTICSENVENAQRLDVLACDNTRSASSQGNNSKIVTCLNRLYHSKQAFVLINSQDQGLFERGNFFSRFVPLMQDHTLKHQLHLPAISTLALLKKFLVVGYSPRALFRESLCALSLEEGENCQVSPEKYMQFMLTSKDATEFNAYIFMQSSQRLSHNLIYAISRVNY